MQRSRTGSFERRSSVNSLHRGQTTSTSPSRGRTPSPSRGRAQSFRGRPSSSRHASLSRSRSRGRSPSRSSSRSPSRRKKHSDNHHHHGLFKTTAGLLAGIGVATVIAHKVWPKGVLYGDHEDWEHPHHKHRHSDRAQRRRRSSDVGERVVERTTRRHGDAIYYEEVDRRRPQNHERMSRYEDDRSWQSSERLAYPPDDPYAQGPPVYQAERRRTVVQPVYVPY
ncbi:hypothetical protein FHETE_7196 [Fusarium heterosporum]|uniref:Uncharacterized protein n=1 Tax=Fusarium heterosporum TaxID=42747 RepID=A0A8H5WMJ4_FUSHE|nr:hypothetical protein FHETE_7196 [Fusarium heterosporum]